jgi:hypothetical protein
MAMVSTISLIHLEGGVDYDDDDDDDDDVTMTTTCVVILRVISLCYS